MDTRYSTQAFSFYYFWYFYAAVRARGRVFTPVE